MLSATRQNPPKKKPGQGKGPRTISGLALDVRQASAFLGMSEKTLRGQVSRGLVPYRRLSARIIFLRPELEAWLQTLDGCNLEEANNNQMARCG